MKFIILLILFLFRFISDGNSQDSKSISNDISVSLKSIEDLISNSSSVINEFDTVVFDINLANFNADFIEFPITIISDDSIYSLDYSFEFNSNNYLFDTVYNVISPLQFLVYYNEADFRLRFTCNSFSIFPLSSPIVYIGFNVLDFSFCELNISQPRAYLNGEPCSIKITDCPNPTVISKQDVSKLPHPNPVKTELFIEQPAGSKIIVLDSFGKQVFERFNPQKEEHLFMGNFENGIYSVRVSTSTSINTYKIVRID